MITLYVEGKSKREINERLKMGATVVGIEHILGRENHYVLNNFSDKAIIKVYSRLVDGNPYAKSYGTFYPKSKQVV